MPLVVGTQLGPYEVLAPIGKGGMGEVYRARDTRLDRTVAIKVLPARLTGNAEFQQRFEREARAISNLTHPNICTLHDIGHDNGIDYLVMEYLEGETLAQRITKGPLPLADVLRIGAEIAAALDRAHRAGVVHRDLKPGNVIITKTGAKLLDFGLAKSTAVLDSDPSAVTVSQPLTGKGTIVGTFQYMAPEQLEGKEADERTDIFAFGAVLYEMATGKRAFEGASRASLIASIMSAQPRAISELQPMSPPALDHVVRSCLAKDPDDRIRTAHDVKLQLQWIAKDGSWPGTTPEVALRPSRRERLPWLVACVAGLAAVLSLWQFARDVAPDARTVHAELMPPEGAAFVYRAGPPALSPDGRWLAFVARSGDETHLWLRDLNRGTLRRLEATKGGTAPFWSPDSKSIGLFVDQSLKRIDVGSGRSDVVCEVPKPEGWLGGGATWNGDNVIVFAAGKGGGVGLYSVSASGGQPTRVTTLDKSTNEFAHRAPWFLPNGRQFLFSTRRGIGGENGVSVGSLDGTPPVRILEVNSNAVFVEPGYVLYWRDGALRGQAFDRKTLKVTGDAFFVAGEVRYEPVDIAALFTVSSNGMLVYHRGQSAIAKSQLVLRDRTGKSIGTVGPEGNYYSPRLSHDGKFVAVDNSGVQNNGDIWIFGVDTPTAIRVTSDPADESRPIWSPKDDRIIYLSGKNGPDNLHSKFLHNLAAEEVLLANEMYLEPTDWSLDGGHVAFNRKSESWGRGGDIWLLSMKDGAAEPLIESPFTCEELVFSPDGNWIAYQTDETGQNEVIVRPFPLTAQKRQVSVSGGTGPKWRSDGKELFYRGLDDYLMAVAFEDGAELKPKAPVALFEVRSRFVSSPVDYDVSPDGETFLINTAITDDRMVPMSMVVNWPAEVAEE